MARKKKRLEGVRTEEIRGGRMNNNGREGGRKRGKCYRKHFISCGNLVQNKSQSTQGFAL